MYIKNRIILPKKASGRTGLRAFWPSVFIHMLTPNSRTAAEWNSCLLTCYSWVWLGIWVLIFSLGRQSNNEWIHKYRVSRQTFLVFCTFGAQASLYTFTYSASTNFRLELIEPSAREVEGQQFFWSSDAVSSLARFEPCSLLLSSIYPRSSLSPRGQKINTSPADGSISSRRK